MGLFSRLANVWKGFLSIWISDIEKEHPEIAYENAINSMIEKYAKLKSATAAIIRRREEVTDRRALGPGGLVEIDHALFGRDERCERGDQLCHRCPAQRLRTRAVGRDNVPVPHDAGRRSGRLPLVDLLKRIHSRAILVT